MAGMLLIAILAPTLTTWDPQQMDAKSRLLEPSLSHWFGTDHMGRDVYSRTIWGTRISLKVGFWGTILSVTFGTLIGLIAGYYRFMDMILMRFMDALMAIPAVLLSIALMAMLGSSTQNVILALTIVQIPLTVRVVRASTLSLRDSAFVEAARGVGASTPRVLLLHILPNTVAPLIVQASYIFARCVLVEAILSFLGAGSPPFIPSWGNIISEGRSYIFNAIWISVFPGILLTLTVMGVNLIGDGLRDILDPKLKGRL